MSQTPTGELHLEYMITTRGLLGLKSVLLKKTRGTAVVHHMFEGYKPMTDSIPGQEPHGSLVALDEGESTAFAISNAQERGELFVEPGERVYPGMVVGEASRPLDVDLNICKQKKMTNMRSSTSDATIVLAPPRQLTLELALEYIGPDELLEVTPKSLRIRKRIADSKLRSRAARREES
jgi:GTP-binding protein